MLKIKHIIIPNWQDCNQPKDLQELHGSRTGTSQPHQYPITVCLLHCANSNSLRCLLFYCSSSKYQQCWPTKNSELSSYKHINNMRRNANIAQKYQSATEWHKVKFIMWTAHFVLNKLKLCWFFHPENATFCWHFCCLNPGSALQAHRAWGMTPTWLPASYDLWWYPPTS